MVILRPRERIGIGERGKGSGSYLGADALKAASRVLVDYHHGLALSATWGEGHVSSLDGQRFGVQESSLLASFYPRYYDRAITVYTHQADQWSVFGQRVISCSEREASFVLDGLLENDTILELREHHTDTHGATEHLFGLCYLLGFAFMPSRTWQTSLSTGSTAPHAMAASTFSSTAARMWP